MLRSPVRDLCFNLRIGCWWPQYAVVLSTHRVLHESSVDTVLHNALHSRPMLLKVLKEVAGPAAAILI
jgi:hypothetical protein